MRSVPLPLTAILLALFWATGAAAQGAPVRIAPPAEAPGIVDPRPALAPPIPGPGPRAPGPEAYGPLLVTPELCYSLAQQMRRPPPSATYQPGSDVYGRPVAPADLPGSTNPTITTEIELGRVTGRSAAFGGDIKGYVTVRPDGSVLLNGQPLAASQEFGLLDFCRQQQFIP
jgi:hypothetical protein